VRPWQHVLEPLGGYLALGTRLLEDPARYCGPWNFGPAHQEVLAVGALADLFFEKLGRGEWVDVSAGQWPTVHEASLLWLSCDKAQMHLDWRPVWTIREAVVRTAIWYREVMKTPDAAQSCSFANIKAYEAAGFATNQWWAVPQVTNHA
jgi:CDP-glucose 4,6-dehydratase